MSLTPFFIFLPQPCLREERDDSIGPFCPEAHLLQAELGPGDNAFFPKDLLLN